jgi:hypothetical protein
MTEISLESECLSGVRLVIEEQIQRTENVAFPRVVPPKEHIGSLRIV